MLSGYAIRNFYTSRIAAVIGGALLTALAVIWLWKPWLTPAAPGRIILAEPIKGYEAPPRWPVTLPDAPDVEKRLESGPTVEVPTLVPKSAKDQRALERETGLDLDAERIVARKDLPKAPGGGTVTAHVPAEGGPVQLTIVARPESWREWDPQFWLGGGYEATPDRIGWAAEVRVSPFRLWRLRPEISGGYSQQRGWYGRAMAGAAW